MPWKQNNGNGCPVGDLDTIRYILRDGSMYCATGADVDWAHTGRPSDILLYKVLPESRPEYAEILEALAEGHEYDWKHEDETTYTHVSPKTLLAAVANGSYVEYVLRLR